MPANSDPDEDVVLDLAIFRRGLVRRLAADGCICAQDIAVVRAFDEPHQALGHRLKLRKAFDSLMRNGVTRRTSDKAKEAGFQLVVSNGELCNVVPMPEPITKEAA